MKRIGFILLDGHALMSTAAAMEPLRAANLFAGKAIYDIKILAVDDDKTASSLGSEFSATPLRHADFDFDIIFVVAGGNLAKAQSTLLETWLKRASQFGIALGGISGGGVVLARAGLMDKRRFTVHWHHYIDIEMLEGQFLLERGLFVIDRDRFTCAGGTAPLDMMHAIIAREHGIAFANTIGEWFIHPEIRNPDAPQRTSLKHHGGPLPATVSIAIELMETHIADQLSLDQLAELAGLSARQLQRKFKQQLGISVIETYRTIRLNKAIKLLQRTALPISDVAQAAGFANQTHFSTCFLKQFKMTPTFARTKSMRSLPYVPSRLGKESVGAIEITL